VHALARYKMIDFLRRHGKRALATEALDDAGELIGASDEEAGQARIDVAKLMQALPERQRTAIVCVKIEGLSVLEAAERTGQSPAAVKVNVHRGLKALAALIRKK
jgi:RNA polymerase sigma-70 factor (ECF subfamily)